MPVGTTRLELRPRARAGPPSTDDLDASRLRRRRRRPDRLQRAGGRRRGHDGRRTRPGGGATSRAPSTSRRSRPCSSAMIAHCELMGDRVAILDTPPDLNAQQVHQWRVNDAGYDSKFATMYWPWIKVFDPASGTNKFVPPSGPHGRRLGAQRRHPRSAQGAGQRGGPRRDQPADPDHQGRARPAQPGRHQLHPQLPGPRRPGLGCPHALQRPGVALPQRPPAVQLPRGVHPAAAPSGWSSSRTTPPCGLASAARSAPSSSTSGARARCSARTPDEAFFVKCDEETNPAEGIDAGQVVCQIGVAPVKPAEFVIFQLSQFSGGTSLVAE